MNRHVLANFALIKTSSFSELNSTRNSYALLEPIITPQHPMSFVTSCLERRLESCQGVAHLARVAEEGRRPSPNPVPLPDLAYLFESLHHYFTSKTSLCSSGQREGGLCPVPPMLFSSSLLLNASPAPCAIISKIGEGFCIVVGTESRFRALKYLGAHEENMVGGLVFEKDCLMWKVGRTKVSLSFYLRIRTFSTCEAICLRFCAFALC